MHTEGLSITIYGLPGTPEYQAAEGLRGIIRRALLPTDSGTISLRTDVYIAGQEREQIDILLHAHFPCSLNRKLRLPYTSEQTDVFFSDIIAVIEVKEHRRDNVDLTGTNAHVLYRDGWKSASSQSHGQIYSVKHFIRHQLGWTPYVCNLIFFPNLLSSDFPSGPNNYLASNSTFQDLLEKLCISRKLIAPNTHSDTAAFCCASTHNAATIEERFKRLQELLGNQRPAILDETPSPAPRQTPRTCYRGRFPLSRQLRFRRRDRSSLSRIFSSFVAGLVGLLLLIALLTRFLVSLH